MLAQADFQSPLFWAVLIAWIITVVLHEFSHGLVAWLGGDYTIRERGGLTLNPLQYVDPVMSIILPMVFLAMGGIPLPGGATYIRRDLLRNRFWEAGVALAGPASNFMLFLILASLLRPEVGWVDPTANISQWTTAQVLVGALAFLQLFATLLNLFPVPPLDGFNFIAPFLPRAWRETLMQPRVSFTLFFLFFLALWRADFLREMLFRLIGSINRGLGFDAYMQFQALRLALWGVSS